MDTELFIHKHLQVYTTTKSNDTSLQGMQEHWVAFQHLTSISYLTISDQISGAYGNVIFADMDADRATTETDQMDCKANKIKRIHNGYRHLTSFIQVNIKCSF
jgi:hypothetical protein